jgi:uncharacterized protein YecE (DUF72 family)
MPESKNLFCGVSGWSRVEDRRQHPLEWIAERLDAAEITESFQRPLKPELTRLWLRKVRNNPRFQFTAKVNKHFTHDRLLGPAEVAASKEGLWPLLREGKLGCLLMQFPWSFRYTAENRSFLLKLRRTFHEFPLAAEMRHASWSLDEAVGTFIDCRLAFCNIDQPSYTKAMPPSAFLTSSLGYVRLHGRSAFNWFQDERAPVKAHRYDYLYSDTELNEWKMRVNRIAGFAEKVFVIANNDSGGKAVINALQLQSLLRGGDGRDVPPELLRRYPMSQAPLFATYPGKAVA